MRCYRARDARLRRLGFNSYKDYLKSDLWKSIRRKVLERDEHKCFRCCGRATQVHHRKYTIPVLEGKNLKQLVSICRACHQKIEFGSNGEKLSIGKVNKSLHSSIWSAGRDVPGICSRCHSNMPKKGSVYCGPCQKLESKVPESGVSAEEIEASNSPAGGWTKETLAKWGITWPPRKGWRRLLIERHEKSTRRP